MPRWLRRLFSTRKEKKMAKKYDILVFDTDATGGKKIEKQTGVMAGSPQELIRMYSMCGQKIQIEREYEDNESKNYGHQEHLDPSKVVMNMALGGGLMKVSAEEQKKIEELEKKQAESHDEKPLEQTVPLERKPRVLTQPRNDPPRFFTVGGIKCKMENGKVYQKQWLRLTDEESDEFRVISDKSNKICPLKDKHIEVMKWVVAETPEENGKQEETSSLICG
jgi:hypothetical protein